MVVNPTNINSGRVILKHNSSIISNNAAVSSPVDQGTSIRSAFMASNLEYQTLDRRVEWTIQYGRHHLGGMVRCPVECPNSSICGYGLSQFRN